MRYDEFFEAVKTAKANNDVEELKHLEWLDGTWFVSVLDELERGLSYKWELVIVWLPESEKEIHAYRTEAEAKEAKAGMEKAFGRQLWACVREKRG